LPVCAADRICVAATGSYAELPTMLIHSGRICRSRKYVTVSMK
jgi:hypothetical protein